MKIKPIGKSEEHTIPQYKYPPTEDFDAAVVAARETAQYWERAAYMGWQEGVYGARCGWWVDSGDFLPCEPDLVVNPDGSVWPFWMTQPVEDR